MRAMFEDLDLDGNGSIGTRSGLSSCCVLPLTMSVMSARLRGVPRWSRSLECAPAEAWLLSRF